MGDQENIYVITPDIWGYSIESTRPYLIAILAKIILYDALWNSTPVSARTAAVVGTAILFMLSFYAIYARSVVYIITDRAIYSYKYKLSGESVLFGREISSYKLSNTSGPACFWMFGNTIKFQPPTNQEVSQKIPSLIGKEMPKNIVIRDGISADSKNTTISTIVTYNSSRKDDISLLSKIFRIMKYVISAPNLYSCFCVRVNVSK